MNNIDLLCAIKDKMLEKKDKYVKENKEKNTARAIGYNDCIIDLLEVLIYEVKGENK